MNTEKMMNAAANAAELLVECPEDWGNSDWNIAIDVDTGSASIDHNTACYSECCGNKNVILMSLYSFDTDGWFEYDDDDDEIYSLIGTKDEFVTEMKTLMLENIQNELTEQF